MLTPEQTDRVEIVLVSPRNPLNIGAAARAMANFGFQRLSIVAPYAVNWMEAKSAVGAPDLLRHAVVHDTLSAAVQHCTLVVGTGSLDRRKPEQTILSLPQAAQRMRAEIAEKTPPHNRVALLFGSEKHGLTAHDLSWCHAIAVIDTCETQPSMNLGQAVAVCLYELSRYELSHLPAGVDTLVAYSADSLPGHSPQPTAPPFTGPPTPAPSYPAPSYPAPPSPDSDQLDRLAQLIEETMAAVNYSTRGMRAANGQALRVLLRRLMPDEADLRRIMGLFRRILWQLTKRTPPG